MRAAIHQDDRTPSGLLVRVGWIMVQADSHNLPTEIPGTIQTVS